MMTVREGHRVNDPSAAVGHGRLGPEDMIGWRHPCRFVRGTAWQPLVDVYETQTEVLVKVELAGVSVEDVEVTLDRDTLAISGHRADPASLTDEVRSVHHREIDTGRFERSVWLPCRVDRSSIHATLKDGFLDITLRKDPDRPRTYTVKVS